MWRNLSILILVFQFAGVAHSSDDGRFQMSESGQAYWLPDSIPYGIYEDFKNELANLKPKPVNQTEIEQCRTSYQKLYSKPEVNWSIYFGYGDGASETYTTDMAERDIFEKEVKAPCPQFRPDIQLCEFKEDTLISGQYTKQIKTKEGQTVTVRLKLFNASLTSEIAVNIEKKDDQKKKSRALEKSYIHALQNDEVVFYSGHARNGSGPGFSPLPTNTLSWLAKGIFRPMATKMYNALGEDDRVDHSDDPFPPRNEPVGKNPAVLGFFACEAEAHFGVNLAHRTGAGLILTRSSITTEDNMRLLYASTNNLLTESCEKDFDQSMVQSIKTVYHAKNEAPPISYSEKMPKFFNFFQKDKVKYRNDILLYFHNKGEIGVELNSSK
ncbi:hypothetical protein CIK05_12865 [Bdellovibrio sp. qaytius]|nr:hypothetical protein CIK05_12865 [Bdellovibrio sp. qaytius]